MQKAVNDVIDIFTSDDMENIYVTGYFLVKHSHLYNKPIYHIGASVFNTLILLLCLKAVFQ